MPHPFRDEHDRTGGNKLQLLVGGEAKMEPAWKKAERISGAQPTTMAPAPVEAVPQFENDRSPRDVPFGSLHKGETDQ